MSSSNLVPLTVASPMRLAVDPNQQLFVSDGYRTKTFNNSGFGVPIDSGGWNRFGRICRRRRTRRRALN